MKLKKYKLSDLLATKTQGVNTTTDNIKYVDNGIRIIQAKNISKYEYTFDNENYVSDKTYLNMKENHKLHNGEVLFTNIGSQLGNSTVYDSEEPAIITWNVLKLIPNHLINNYFLCYYLNYRSNYIKTLNSSSTMPFVSGQVLLNMECEIPDLPAQEKIVKIVKTINDKIKLNNEISNNLHELLKNIYEDWFINYNYPNSKEKLHSNWTTNKLGEYLNVERGLSYKGKFLSDDGVPMINLGNVMPDGVFRLEKNKYYSGEYKEKVTAKAGDIVIANTDMTQDRAVIGSPVIIPNIYNSDIIYSHHIYGVKNLKLPRMFVFYTLLRKEFRAIAGGSATGTTVLALPKDVIENYEIEIPDKFTLEAFSNIAETIYKKREILMLQNIKLEQLRDTLLPKLMNGEIDLDKIEI